MKGRGTAWRLRRGSRERSSLVIAGNRRFPACSQNAVRSDDITKGAKRLSNDHVRRRPVPPAAHSANPDIRGALRRELGRATSPGDARREGGDGIASSRASGRQGGDPASNGTAPPSRGPRAELERAEGVLDSAIRI